LFASKIVKNAKQSSKSRVITGKSYEVRSSEILRELDWQTLEIKAKEV
jgi:hypothetical protein